MPASAPKIESSHREGEEPVKLPPTVQINKLSDKFREALGRGEPAAPQNPPAEPPPEKPAADKLQVTPPTTKPDKTQVDPTKEPKIPREHFKVLETQRDEFKTKWEAAEARTREFEAKAKELESKVPNDYDDIKAKLAEQQIIVDKFYVEQSPQFKAAFDSKITAGIEEAKEIVGTEHAERIADLMTMAPSAKRDAEISEITEEMPAFKRDALVQTMREVRKLQKERTSELSKASDARKYLDNTNAQRATQERVARQEALERSVRVATSDAAKQSIHFQKLDGNQEHNERVAENEKMLKEFATSDLSPDDHARLAFWAVRGIRSSQTDVIKDALIQKLQNELKAINDATPRLDGAGKGAGDKTAPKSAADKDPEALDKGIPDRD